MMGEPVSDRLERQHYRILVLPGDHVGPEVMVEALKVFDVVSKHLEPKGVTFELSHDIIGGISIDKEGTPVTQRVLDKSLQVDAVLFGSVGGPEWGTAYPNPESGGLGRLRVHMGAYANIRPCKIYSPSLIPLSPLKPAIVTGTDFVVLRENCGGAYFGKKIEGDEYAADTWEYSAGEIERCAHMAAALAREMGKDGQGHGGPATVWSVDKANVLASGRIWRNVTTAVFARDYPDVTLRHMLADAVSMVMMKSPTSLNGVIHTDNTFGDLLSDQAGGVTGTLGTLPSASLCGLPGPGRRPNGIYEPVHGSAPDISGQQKVNPVAQILSMAMMLRYSFGLVEEAEAVERAVKITLDDKDIGGVEIRTGDLKGYATTSQVGDAVAGATRAVLAGGVGKVNGVAV